MLNQARAIHPAQMPEKPMEFSSLIGGSFIRVGSRPTIERENPAHGGLVSRYPHATAEDVGNAIAAARTAFDVGVWSRMPGKERHRILMRVADLIDRNRSELALIETLEGGKPIANTDDEIQASIDNWEYGATLARHMYGDTYDTLEDGRMGFTFRDPVGVIGMITPWNYPLGSVSQKLPFALAAGNCAVIKPSEMTSGTTLRLGELLIEAGLPEGVVNIVAGYGGDVGQAIVENLDVDMISFTGSTRVGRQIGRIGGETLRRVSLELGGKSAQVVFADCDIERAAQMVAAGITKGAGQVCVAGSRLLVEAKIADTFRDAVFENMKKVRVGDPFDPATQVGPVISRNQLDRINGYVEQGQKQGASVVVADFANPGLAEKGYYVRPTLFSNVRHGMKIEQEEIFGPVLAAMTFETAEEALHIANGTNYGLYAGVWTKNIDKAFTFVRHLKAGVVEINGYNNGSPELPLSGFKESGIGLEKGRHSLGEYTEIKTVQLTLTPAIEQASVPAGRGLRA
jgi:betaine-aldehyde dehydrogenase